MKNIETLITLGMVNLESRLYSSKNGYLGISFNAYAGKNFVQVSWLGISWGLRFYRKSRQTAGMRGSYATSERFA